MPVITILIAAAIAAGVSYALHFLGEDNNRKESVKKYADKRQAEIAAFINEQVKKHFKVKSIMVWCTVAEGPMMIEKHFYEHF